jgi:hypothetical protein
VIELGNEATSCALLFDDDEQFRYTLMEPSRFDLDQLAKAQFIIVNETAKLNETLQQALLNCVADGAAMLVFPSKDDPKNNALLVNKLGLSVIELDTNATVVQDLAIRHEFFSDVILDMPQHADLPKVKKHLSVRSNGVPSTLLVLQNGEPMLFSETVGQGQVFVMTTTLDPKWSDLADHSLFVPMMVKMALLGGQLSRLSYTIGQDKILALKDMSLEGDRRFLFVNADRSFEQMPASEVRNGKVYLYLNENLPSAGFYDLLVNDSVNHVTAWNESRVESKMEFVDRDEVGKAFAQASIDVAAVLDTSEFATADLMEAMAHQSSQWKLFALIALIALLAEIVVLRFWR